MSRFQHDDTKLTQNFREVEEDIRALQESFIPIGGTIRITGIDPSIENDPEALSRLIPKGFLYANGDEVSQSQYPKLFERIGFVYGTPTIDSAFKLPSLGYSSRSIYVVRAE